MTVTDRPTPIPNPARAVVRMQRTASLALLTAMLLAAAPAVAFNLEVPWVNGGNPYGITMLTDQSGVTRAAGLARARGHTVVATDLVVSSEASSSSSSGVQVSQRTF